VDGTAPRDKCCLFETACSRETFHTTLTHLSCNRAAGPDGVPNELLKILSTEALYLLLTFDAGLLHHRPNPLGLETAEHNVAVHKGDPNELLNYRPSAG
jgi:hypothetical protein